MAIKQGGVFFYSAKAYRCLDFSTERPVAFTSIVVRLVKKHVTFDNNYITFDTDLERDLNSVSPDHEIELQRPVLSDEYQNYQAKNFPTKVSSCFQQVLVALIKINRIFVNQT